MSNHPNRSNFGTWPSPTPEEFRELRLRHGLTQTQAGILLKSPLRTVQGWEGGTRRIPPMAWDLLRIRLGELAHDDVDSIPVPRESGD